MDMIEFRFLLICFLNYTLNESRCQGTCKVFDIHRPNPVGWVERKWKKLPDALKKFKSVYSFENAEKSVKPNIFAVLG